MSAVLNQYNVASTDPFSIFPSTLSAAEPNTEADPQPRQPVVAKTGISRYQARRALRKLRSNLMTSVAICGVSMTICGSVGLLSVSSSVAFACGSVVAYIISFAETSKAFLPSQEAAKL